MAFKNNEEIKIHFTYLEDGHVIAWLGDRIGQWIDDSLKEQNMKLSNVTMSKSYIIPVHPTLIVLVYPRDFLRPSFQLS